MYGAVGESEPFEPHGTHVTRSTSEPTDNARMSGFDIHRRAREVVGSPSIDAKIAWIINDVGRSDRGFSSRAKAALDANKDGRIDDREVDGALYRMRPRRLDEPMYSEALRFERALHGLEWEKESARKVGKDVARSVGTVTTLGALVLLIAGLGAAALITLLGGFLLATVTYIIASEVSESSSADAEAASQELEASYRSFEREARVFVDSFVPYHHASISLPKPRSTSGVALRSAHLRQA